MAFDNLNIYEMYIWNKYIWKINNEIYRNIYEKYNICMKKYIWNIYI